LGLSYYRAFTYHAVRLLAATGRVTFVLILKVTKKSKQKKASAAQGYTPGPLFCGAFARCVYIQYVSLTNQSHQHFFPQNNFLIFITNTCLTKNEEANPVFLLNLINHNFCAGTGYHTDN
jgi:hypothetical protein